MLCKCLSGLMQSYCYLQRDLASIHSMTNLQAIYLRRCATCTMTSFHSKISPIEVEVILM